MGECDGCVMVVVNDSSRWVLGRTTNRGWSMMARGCREADVSDLSGGGLEVRW